MKFPGYRSAQGQIGIKNSFDWVDEDSGNKLYNSILKSPDLVSVEDWDDGRYMGSCFALSPFAMFGGDGGMCFGDMPYYIHNGCFVPIINDYVVLLLDNYRNYNTITDVSWWEDKDSEYHEGWDMTNFYDLTENIFGSHKHVPYSLLTVDTPIVTVLSGEDRSIAMVGRPTGEIVGSENQVSITVDKGKIEPQISMGYSNDMQDYASIFGNGFSPLNFLLASIAYRAFSNLALALHFPKELFDALLSVVTDVEKEVPSDISFYIFQAIYGTERLKYLLESPETENVSSDLFNVWRV